MISQAQLLHVRGFPLLTAISVFLLVGRNADAQVTASGWKNTRPGVRYVGTDKCVRCHPREHASYLKTTHSVSAAKTDPSKEPESGTYEHPLSGFRYEVERKNGRLVHREIMRDVDGDSLAVTEHAMAYSIGSGTHGKSYLYATGPFLGQSPLTWYQDIGSWEMSPGFDKPYHTSFRRNIRTGCVFCHVGSIDRKDGNPYQFQILETAIGCERCHGPGELHVKQYAENPNAVGVDRTIVNPSKLDRELAEAVCQQCHLQGAGKATVSGQDQWDFRPGLPLIDFHVDYQFRLANEQMRIVGHVEQLQSSECYQKTDTLTCTTCHNPHDPHAGAEKASFYRSVCLECHRDESCGKPRQQRIELADNNCHQCHMPRRETNVTHAALHRHRIGIHATSDDERQIASTGLAPILDISKLPKRERERCAAIAKVGLLRSRPTHQEVQGFGYDATEALIRLKQTGPLDALGDSTVAWLALMQDQRPIAEQIAEEVLKNESRPTLARIEATSMLGQIMFEKGDAKRAAELFRQATGYYRDARDAFYLGLCLNNLGDVKGAIASLNRSLEIDPTQVSAHAALRAIYEATDQPDKAALHQQAQLKKTALLQKLRKD